MAALPAAQGTVTARERPLAQGRAPGGPFGDGIPHVTKVLTLKGQLSHPQSSKGPLLLFLLSDFPR